MRLGEEKLGRGSVSASSVSATTALSHRLLGPTMQPAILSIDTNT